MVVLYKVSTNCTTPQNTEEKVNKIQTKIYWTEVQNKSTNSHKTTIKFMLTGLLKDNQY